jgi:hypothetical protein
VRGWSGHGRGWGGGRAALGRPLGPALPPLPRSAPPPLGTHRPSAPTAPKTSPPGLLPVDAIIADRAFNARAAANAYLGDGPGGLPSVQAAAYDPRGAPDRLTLEFSRVGQDMRPLPPRRAELYIQRMCA